MALKVKKQQAAKAIHTPSGVKVLFTNVKVKGMSFRPKASKAFMRSKRFDIALAFEPKCKEDPNAIAVMGNGKHIGYIPQATAYKIAMKNERLLLARPKRKFWAIKSKQDVVFCKNDNDDSYDDDDDDNDDYDNDDSRQSVRYKSSKIDIFSAELDILKAKDFEAYNKGIAAGLTPMYVLNKRIPNGLTRGQVFWLVVVGLFVIPALLSVAMLPLIILGIIFLIVYFFAIRPVKMKKIEVVELNFSQSNDPSFDAEGVDAEIPEKENINVPKGAEFSSDIDAKKSKSVKDRLGCLLKGIIGAAATIGLLFFILMVLIIIFGERSPIEKTDAETNQTTEQSLNNAASDTSGALENSDSQ